MNKQQRVLKFRAWEKNHKKMYDRVLAGPGDPCSSVYDEERKEWVHFDEFCGTIIQYIGLQDCAGKPIYEGDILSMENASARVVYWPPEFGLNYRHNMDEWCEDWTLVDDCERMEIIGNVYEHPHLLETKV